MARNRSNNKRSAQAQSRFPRLETKDTDGTSHEMRTGHGSVNLLLVGAIAVIAAEALEPKLASASVQGCVVSAEALIWHRATLLTQQV